MNGDATAEFECWLAEKNKTKYAVTCHSGTHALEIVAAWWLDHILPMPFVQPRVLMPTMTYPATANAFMRQGWQVCLIDCDAQGIMNLNKINPTVDFDLAVIVGLYGASIYDLINDRWSQHFKEDSLGLCPPVVEDGAQHWLSHDCDRLGYACAISFDPTKNLANYGNGGAVVTSDKNLEEFARSWRDNAKPTHNFVGTNSRMSEVDCAQLLVKTRYIDQWQQRRADIARYWMDRFQKVEGLRSLITPGNIKDHGLQKFVIDVDFRDQLETTLRKHMIEVKVHYRSPVHEQTIYRDKCQGPDIMSVASSLSRRCLSLPFYPELTDLEVEYIADTVVDCVQTSQAQDPS